ncbi:MAG: transglutaminase domain-containing protein, partial [Clostridia bacterium]|nr:transglutaminase domain-containing protein [Clostridia bacterium]
MKKIFTLTLVCIMVLSQITAFGYPAKKTETIDCIDREYTFLNQAEWVDLQSGDGYFAGIREDGSLWMWGNNEQGQLGIGLERRRLNAPVKVMEDVAKAYPSKVTTLVVKKDGSVWCFGGEKTLKPEKIGIENVMAASMDDGRVAYVDNAGKAYVYNVKNGNSVLITDNAVNIKMVFNNFGIRSVGKKKKELSIKESVRASKTAPAYIILVHKENGDVEEYYYGRYNNLDALIPGTTVLAEDVTEMTASYVNYFLSFAFRKADGTVVYGDSTGEKDMESVMIGAVKSVHNTVGGPLVLKEDGTLWKWNAGYCYGNNVKFYAAAVDGAVWMIDNNNKHYVLHEKEKFQETIRNHFDIINLHVEYYEEKKTEPEYPDIYAKTMEIVAGETDKYKQAKLVSEWISRNIKYKHSEHDQSGVAAFREGTGVCAAYASLTDIMLSYLDIPTMYITGNTASGTPHAWNAAIIDGTIVFIDNTGNEFDYDWMWQYQSGGQLIAARVDSWASEEVHGAYDYNLMADGRL